MRVKAIVCTSNTGFTAEYAKLLGKKLGLPIYTLDEAKRGVSKADEIIYISWIRAGTVVDYKKAARMWEIAAVCAVGLSKSGAQVEGTRAGNSIPQKTKVFTLQGGYAPDKLRGINKAIMKIISRGLIKQITYKAEQTEADITMLNTLKNGGSYVKEENLKPVLEYFDAVFE